MNGFNRFPGVVTLVDDHALLSDSEIELVLHDVLEVYGYDFTDYSRPSFKRRVSRLFNADRFLRFSDFRQRLRTQHTYFTRFLGQITVGATEMFRDPAFYRAMREQVLPAMAHLKEIRIWHAGCSTGEEVFSMAILLYEAGLLQRSQLFATDINPGVLQQVHDGIYPLSNMKNYEENYRLSGGNRDFRSYYSELRGSAVFDKSLTLNTQSSVYNLVSGQKFGEFHLILCRNVLIYFDKPLQDRILRLLHSSLAPDGFLGLGSKETLKFTAVDKQFEQVSGGEKIWRGH